MTEKTARQIEALKNQTIGVEVEMNNITRKEAAKTAAEYFGTGRYEDTARRNGYFSWSAWDADGREWKFQRDVSIAGPDDEKCEMVTPILRYEDIETLQEVCRRLRKAGAKSDATRGCGVHIHIGANGHTPQTLRNLANIMASHEQLLAKALRLDSGRMSDYCRTVNPTFLKELNAKKPDTMAKLADIKGYADEVDSRTAQRSILAARNRRQSLSSACPLMFSIYQVLPEILDLWGANIFTDVQSKKNLNQAVGK